MITSVCEEALLREEDRVGERPSGAPNFGAGELFLPPDRGVEG